MRVKIQAKTGTKIVNLNRRKAIRERCLNCTGWEYKEVANCEFVGCALYTFRSGQGKQNAKERDKAIRKYCMWCMCDQRSEIAKCTCPDCPIFPYRLSGGVDRSVEVATEPKNDHIEPGFEDKIQDEYRNIG